MTDHQPTTADHQPSRIRARLQQPRLHSAWQTLWTGGAASILAFFAGWGLRAMFGAG